MKYKLKKNDMVQIITGKDKGKSGRILRLDGTNSRILVEGLNMGKKAVKRRKESDKAGIQEVEIPIHISNVLIVCRKCGPAKLKYTVTDGKKIRVCRKCGEPVA